MRWITRRVSQFTAAYTLSSDLSVKLLHRLCDFTRESLRALGNGLEFNSPYTIVQRSMETIWRFRSAHNYEYEPI